MITNTAIVLLLIISWLNLRNVGAPPASFSGRGFAYLNQFGYLNESQSTRNSILDRNAISDAVRMFQQFAGLPVTGTFDERTLEKMSQKRCGNQDIFKSDETSRKKRFVLQGTKWSRPNLTYKITQYTRDLTINQVNREIATAFGWWSFYSSLTFVQVRGPAKADIEIRFTTGDHGDNDPFDDSGQILAHAFFPSDGGDAHFDDAETWLLRPAENGVSLRIIAAHEIGHSLGLEHSSDSSALMAPFYNEDSTRLAQDDISAIRSLYQKLAPTTEEMKRVVPTATTRRKTTTTTTTTTRRNTNTRTSLPPSTCNGRFDAITQLSNGTTFVFQGDQFWRLNQLTIDAGYPKRISSTWRYLRKVDAALSFGSYIDLFYRSIVYRVNERLEPRPAFIHTVYRGLPRNITGIDAAFRWRYNGITSTYLIRGDQYWRYNNETNQVDDGYPRPLSVWTGLPDKIDAAFQWNNRTYFFSDGLYYRYGDTAVNVAQLQRRPYPRRADRWWLNCIDGTFNFTETVVEVGTKEGDRMPENAKPKFAFSFSLILISSFFAFVMLLFN